LFKLVGMIGFALSKIYPGIFKLHLTLCDFE